MLEQLKRIAAQKLMEKMAGNSLNETATNEAANEGVGALMESIQGGDISQITALFSGGAEGGNGIAENIQGKISQILQNKGMNAEEAQTESAATSSDLINGLRERFQSPAEEDSAFDLSAISNLVGGNAGGILNAAKNLFGK